MASTEDLEWLAGPTDLAHLLHVKVPTLTAWMERQAWNGFPHEVPVGSGYGEGRLIRGPLFDAREVIRWWDAWTPLKRAPKLGYVDEQILTELGLNPKPQGANNGEIQS